mmetsp:Transcript_46307/g.112247  ORF Transcript_46307/g.112247 Transcript_46307/m.112247 type:complete len:227 (+) Transcript_46307:744-1424(+)
MALRQVCYSPGIIPIDPRLFIDNHLVHGLFDARVELLGDIETNVVVESNIWLKNLHQHKASSGRIIHNAGEGKASIKNPRILSWSVGYGLVIEPTKLKELGGVEAHLGSLTGFIGVTHHPSLVSVFITAHAGMTEVQVVPDFVHLCADRGAQFIVVNRKYTIHNGVSHTAKGSFWQTIHDMTRNTINCSSKFFFNCPRYFIDYRIGTNLNWHVHSNRDDTISDIRS